jgi:Mor family transcriptional regulator
MDKGQPKTLRSIDLTASSRDFFYDLVNQAVKKRQIRVSQLAVSYLVDLLNIYVVNSKVHADTTLAELLLRAQNAEKNLRFELLKKLGDTSLYVSGFFGDSLRRKIVDIDYYASMGGLAYASLAKEVDDKDQSIIFLEFGERFLDYVDLLTYVSQSTSVQNNQDLLRLYERYVVTGSPLAKDQLVEKGLINPVDRKKIAQ